MSAAFIRTVIQRVCIGVGAVLLLAVAFDYEVVTVRVNKEADERLAQNARMISQLAGLNAERSATGTSSVNSPARDVAARSSDAKIGFEIWSNANVPIAGSDAIGGIGLDAVPAGFADVSIKDHRWRLFTLLGDEGRWVRVGESYENRDSIDHLILFCAFSSLLVFCLLAFFARGVVSTFPFPARS